LDEHGTNDGLSRRALIKRALLAGGYAAPVLVSMGAPAGVAAATPPMTADLAVTKTVNTAFPVVASSVTFTVSVTNNGPIAATGVLLNDTLPAGLTFVSATPGQGAYNGASGVWTIGTLAAAQTVTLTIVATAAGPAGVARTNTATVTSATADPNLANNSASATVTPQAAPTADIAVTKAVNIATPIVSTNVTFTVNVTNNGPSDASGVIVNDALPAGLAFVGATPSQGTYNSTTGMWTIGMLAAGQGVVLSIVATATRPVGTARTNTATLAASSPTDPNLANNSASATVTPQAAPTADIAVTKTVNIASPIAGSAVTFTATVTNNGPNAATGVVVMDSVPAGFTFTSATPSQGTYSSATGIWTIGALAVGQSVTLMMSGTVGLATVTNIATLTASSPTDPNAANNSASAVVTPQPPTADIAVTKTVDNPTPRVEGAIIFTVTVTNNGPNAATSVVVSDPTPAGLSFVTVMTATGSYNSGTGVWTIGALAVGQSATLTMQGSVLEATVTNVATVTASSPTDPVPGNNSASATAIPVIPV
jgi:uncharacterized repeat protein (TIGR01451 family)